MADKLLELSQPLDRDPKNVRLKAIAGDPDSAHAVAVYLPDTSVVTPGTLTPSSPAFATIGMVSSQALAANDNRRGLIVINTSANIVSIAFGVAAVLYSGITLNASGGSFEMGIGSKCTGAVYAIASGISSNLSIQEFVT